MKLQAARQYAIAVLTLAAANGCVARPVSTAGTDNTSVNVDLLFTHDGCRVYRFVDNGYHYFARCDNAVSSSTSQMVSCGKNCSYEELVETGYVPPPRASATPSREP